MVQNGCENESCEPCGKAYSTDRLSYLIGHSTIFLSEHFLGKCKYVLGLRQKTYENKNGNLGGWDE
jgi:hypothetical protein